MRVPHFLRGILIGIPIGVTFLNTVGYIAKVEGISMQPTLNPDTTRPDYVFLNRWAVRTQEIQRGEIISLVSPKTPNQELIKRVIGIQGDFVTTHGYKTKVLRVPQGHCWIEGDHAGHSMDSNFFGPVSLGLVTAKATVIVWPPSRWQYLYPSMSKRNFETNLSTRLQWELPGTVCRHGLTIGDVDNDGDNELVVGTAEGELYIFKGSELWQKITGLGLVTSVAIGDIFNYGRNALVVICGDGWAHIFYSPRSVNPSHANAFAQQLPKDPLDQETVKASVGHASVDIGPTLNATSSPISDPLDGINEANELSGKMECVHVQRIPTNTKVVLVADVDKDGANEMILGLTDRVVRSYRWSSNLELGRGKLVGLNKWECANQIGTVTLQHTGDGTPTLLVAQPGGTFMRIKCNPEDCHLDDETHEPNNETAASCVDYQTLGISRMRNQNISTEIIGDLESSANALASPMECRLPINEFKRLSVKQRFPDEGELDEDNEFKVASLEYERNYPGIESQKTESEIASEDDKSWTSKDREGAGTTSDSPSMDQVDGNIMGGNVILGDYDEKMEKSSFLPSYKDFSRDNNNVQIPRDKDKTVIDAGQTVERSPRGKPYALATLDGTIMLVKDEIILWAMQVDHQIFALCRLDVTGDGSDEIVACAWDGQTYILDQQQNSVRFQFEEPVRAFCTGNYSVAPGISTSCLVYNTFNNKISLYYDVTLPSMVIKPLNPLEELETEEGKELEELLGNCADTERHQRTQQLTEWLLYGAF